MSYKTNYELYSRGSIDSRRSPPPSDELLSPLATLYPHVAALQPQYNPSNCTFTGYRETGYWAAAYTTQPVDDSSISMRRTGKLYPVFSSSVAFSSNIPQMEDHVDLFLKYADSSVETI
ncbi:uncharacterized protein N7518_003268 [Penicillium psychrosexuale]|uniref:uncharacterized protein n=1 Tax=Penicillium psychrosexuale TaxID=1002107 RepID=UPI0025459FAC|nr:uncharacterized protein N7518_003268 [Penicillium psychrosexuale]KAJ5801200.1 hypothetical protein N7518_003268 [Penicillium psychrosexuale]